MVVAFGLGCGGSGVELDESGEHFVAAQQALAEGNREKAMAELTAAIKAGPDPWAYYQRAKLYSDAGDEKAALADCEAGLKIDPENTSLKWLQGELKKPKAKRFKGKFAKPPIETK